MITNYNIIMSKVTGFQLWCYYYCCEKL